jgi:arylsulfatase A-like enzyme
LRANGAGSTASLLATSVVALLMASATAAPSGAANAAAANGWQRVDLWATAPQQLRGTRDAFAAILAGQAADLPPRPNAPPGGAVLTAPRLRAIRQGPSTLAWRLRLGREPYLAFTPVADDPPCPAAAAVAVAKPGGEPTSVWNAATPRSPWPAGPEVTVDLARWAGRDVELQLDVKRTRNGSRSCAMLWGSPEVVSRAAGTAAPRPAGAPPSILLVGADTLRADALGAWGRRPSVTPALDALAAESDVWLDAFSTSNATNPSFASIMTGLYVQQHGVRDLATPLPAAQVTLAERLAAAGYDTYAVIAAQHMNPPRSGLGQGFAAVASAEHTSAARLAVDRALSWLQRPRTRPFFLWLHLFDPHTPHLPPAPYAFGERAAAAFGLSPVRAWTRFRAGGLPAFRLPGLGADRDLYLSEVAYLDRQLDRLLGFLRSRGTLADTLVVFVADHGENLEDHGVRYRHAGLWDTTTHVPLMIRWPDRRAPAAPAPAGGGARPPARRLRGLVQTIDLFPTILAAAGRRAETGEGRDLRALVEGGRRGRPAVFAEQADGKGAAVRTTGWRYFVSAGSRVVPAGTYLYDLTRDPGELTNLAGAKRREEAELRALLAVWRRGAKPRAAPSQLTAEEEAALRALGYE